MHFQSVEKWPLRKYLEQSAVEVRRQIDADRSHITYDLRRRFLERKEQRALAFRADRSRKRRGEARLSHPGRGREQNAGAAIKAAHLQHGVEVPHATRYH